jgi:DNA (cytosine-5)-methyltransferase 1
VTLTYGSVCSGIEAATMAWEPLGWKPAFFSEIDRAASMVLAHHYGSNRPGEPLATNGVPNHGDFTQIPSSAGPVDLLVGGTPCQSFSIAGKRLGLDDPRGNLAIEYVRLARRLGARWLVWENVPGVLSSNGGRDFAAFVGLLVECGYGVAWRVLDAQYVRTQRFPWAVPQRRRRVFLVGYTGDWRRAAAVLFEPEGMRRDPPPRRQAGQGVAPTISARTSGGGGLGTDFDCDGGLIAQSDWPASVAPTLDTAFHDKQGLDDQHIRGGAGYSCPAVANPLTARMHKGINTTADEGQTPIISHGGGFDGAVVFDSKGTEVETRTDGATPTLRAMASADGRNNAGGQLAVATSWAVRRLTPRECERLQGFPDDFTLVPGLRGKPMADGPRYKMLGNSMAVNVMAWIGERIAACEASL